MYAIRIYLCEFMKACIRGVGSSIPFLKLRISTVIFVLFCTGIYSPFCGMLSSFVVLTVSDFWSGFDVMATRPISPGVAWLSIILSVIISNSISQLSMQISLQNRAKMASAFSVSRNAVKFALVLALFLTAARLFIKPRPQVSVITVVTRGDEYLLSGFLQNIVEQTAFDRSELLIATLDDQISEHAQRMIDSVSSRHSNVRRVSFGIDVGLYEVTVSISVSCVYFLSFTFVFVC